MIFVEIQARIADVRFDIRVEKAYSRNLLTRNRSAIRIISWPGGPCQKQKRWPRGATF